MESPKSSSHDNPPKTTSHPVLQWIVLFIAIIGVLVLVPITLRKDAWQLITQNTQKTVCTNTGGQWVMGPLHGNTPAYTYCNKPTKDENTICYQDSQCSNICAYSGKVDKDGYLLGYCTRYSIDLCQEHMPYKTKNRATLQTGDCA